MRKLLTLALFVTLMGGALSLSAQQQRRQVNQYDIEMITLPDGKQFAHANGRRDKPILGPVRINPGYATEYIDAYFRDGYPEGEWRYYKNDKLTTISNHKNGFLHGAHIEFNQNETPRLKSLYNNGKKDGKWFHYSYDGKIDAVEEYNNDKLLKKVTYHPNGKLASDRSYKDGLEHGISKQFTETGQLQAENTYQMGKRIGTQVTLVEGQRGNYLQIANYNAQGDMDGEYKEIYLPSKGIKIRGNYRNGKRDGKWILAHPVTQQIYKEEVYSNGTLKSSNRL